MPTLVPPYAPYLLSFADRTRRTWESYGESIFIDAHCGFHCICRKHFLSPNVYLIFQHSRQFHEHSMEDYSILLQCCCFLFDTWKSFLFRTLKLYYIKCIWCITSQWQVLSSRWLMYYSCFEIILLYIAECEEWLLIWSRIYLSGIYYACIVYMSGHLKLSDNRIHVFHV